MHQLQRIISLFVILPSHTQFDLSLVTKNNTANTEHLLSNSSQQIFIFQNDFSIETTDDILDEDETANLSGDDGLAFGYAYAYVMVPIHAPVATNHITICDSAFTYAV
jgi:hypothetical protein